MPKLPGLKIESYRLVSAAAFNQALSSIANFVFTFYLLQVLPAEEFGLFGIGFAVSLFIFGFAQGFFTLQYIVLAQAEAPGLFASRTYTTLVLASILAAAGSLFAAVVVQSLAGPGLFVLGTCLAGVSLALKEFLIRHAFNEQHGQRAVAINAVTGTALLFILLWIEAANIALNADFALLVYSFVTSTGILFGHFRADLKLGGHRKHDLVETLSKLAFGGKWMLLANFISTLRGNAHTIVLALILGPVAVAKVNAARLFLTPAIMLLPSLSTIALPRFALTFHRDGLAALNFEQCRAGALLVCAALFYALGLFLVWPFLETRLLDPTYHGLAPLLTAWSLFAVALALRSSIEWGAQARRLFALIAKVSASTAVFAIGVSWVLAHQFGPVGAVVAITLAEVLMVASIWVVIRMRS